MSEVENLLSQLLDKMSEVASTLEGISDKLDNVNGIYGLDDVVTRLDEVSNKLDNINGAYGLDDIVEKLGEVSSDIVGPACCDLTDIHGALASIESELSNVNATLMLKD